MVIFLFKEIHLWYNFKKNFLPVRLMRKDQDLPKEESCIPRKNLFLHKDLDPQRKDLFPQRKGLCPQRKKKTKDRDPQRKGLFLQRKGLCPQIKKEIKVKY